MGGDTYGKSHPARGAWIEMTPGVVILFVQLMSHPARGAWIEMTVKDIEGQIKVVAPRKGCVD